MRTPRKKNIWNCVLFLHIVFAEDNNALLITFRMFYGTLISKFNKSLEQTAIFLKFRIVGYQLDFVF